MRLSAVQKFSLLDYPGLTSCIAFLPGCNFRCGYCHNSEFVLPDKIKELEGSFIDDDSFFNFLKKRNGLIDGVVISGGEPTIHAKLPEFIKKIRGLGYKVKLDTNGSNPVMLKKILEEKLIDYVAMDYKSSLNKYNNFTLIDLSKKIKESFDLLSLSKIDWEIRITLIKELHDFEEIKMMSEEISGAPKVYLQQFRADNVLDRKYQFFNPYSYEELEVVKSTFFSNFDQVTVRR